MAGNTLFKQVETKPGEILTVKYYPRVLLEGEQPDVTKQNGNLSSGNRLYQSHPSWDMWREGRRKAGRSCCC